MENSRSPGIHIVTFDIPYPANYGGAIDVFHRIRCLSASGVRVVLHAYRYGGREVLPELEAHCEAVYTYNRNMHWRHAAGTTPYIMASRKDPGLASRLSHDSDPVLLEGMHTSALLDNAALRDRITAVRMHNLEWSYYRALFRQEEHWVRRLYYLAESIRLKHARSILAKAGMLLAISEADMEPLSSIHPDTRLLPAFHRYDEVISTPGAGDYVLYHGNLGISENRRMAEWLMDKVLKGMDDIPLYIAGANVPEAWRKLWSGRAEIIPDPSDEALEELILRACANVLPGMERAGVKLKLLHALFAGRHCIVSAPTVHGSGLAPLCRVAEGIAGFRDAIRHAWETPFTEADVQLRKKVLGQRYDNRKNARMLTEWLCPRP